METVVNDKMDFIGNAYEQYHDNLIVFISSRIKNVEMAKDIAHDVFIKLIDYQGLLLTESVKSFIYTLIYMTEWNVPKILSLRIST